MDRFAFGVVAIILVAKIQSALTVVNLPRAVATAMSTCCTGIPARRLGREQAARIVHRFCDKRTWWQEHASSAGYRRARIWRGLAENSVVTERYAPDFIPVRLSGYSLIRGCLFPDDTPMDRHTSIFESF